MAELLDQALGLEAVYPVLILVIGAIMILLYGVFRGESSGLASGWLAVAVMAGAGYFVARNSGATLSLFHGAFVVDDFARFMKMLTLIGAAVTLVMSFDYLRRAGILKFEYPVLVLLSTAGMFVMISAGDLIALYLGLEMQSLALYVIASFRRDSVRSSEAGLKYFVLGALSSGMLLYGASLIYGFTGSTHFKDIAAAVAAAPSLHLGVVFGLVFLLAGLAFKVSAVPFHMWTPDVYEGAPTPVTAFFAAAPKMAAMALLLRTMLVAFAGIGLQWQQIIIFLSLLSMALGAFGAIGQTNIKRLMAYSSIGHVGYALVGLAAGTPEGTRGVLVYLAIYLVMTLGTFAAILGMRRGDAMVEEIDELAGLARTNLPMAAVIAMLFFSLAGIPPLAGFFAKFYVFLPAVQAGLYWLAVLGVLASVVGAYYYLRIVKIMFFDEAAEPFQPLPATLWTVMIVSALLLFPVLAVMPARPWRRPRWLPSRCSDGAMSGHCEHPSELPGGWRLIYKEETGSTNADALALAAAGDPGRVWVMAGRQTAGRGRASRPWRSEAGNLHASALVRLDMVPWRAAQLSLVAGVALHEAVATLIGECAAVSSLRLKWPNDLLLDGGKLGGILVETVTPPPPAAGLAAVVGFGVNLATAPDIGDPARPAAALCDLGLAVRPEAALDVLGHGFDRWLGCWSTGDDLGPVRQAFLERTLALGTPISVNGAEGPRSGQFAGLDRTGALLLAGEGGRVLTITFGDVAIGTDPAGTSSPSAAGSRG
ncbi:MAG: NADH-quinone oxidoreductase subunit NuoN [Hyphomicrobiaceae bacterium]